MVKKRKLRITIQHDGADVKDLCTSIREQLALKGFVFDKEYAGTMRGEAHSITMDFHKM